MFQLSFALDNAAFVDEKEQEIAAVLERVRMAVINGHQRGKVRDSNGNTVGEWIIDYR